MRAGGRYFIELYELSSEKQNTLKLGFDVLNGGMKSILAENPISKVNLVYDVPRK